MLRYFLDEHLDLVIAEQLRRRGIDAVAAQDVGRAGKKIPDPIQLAYATNGGRVMVSKDRDFIMLADSQHPHAGIILLQKDFAIGDLVEYLELLALTSEPDDLRDRLTYCDW